jgi:hypothetical protein
MIDKYILQDRVPVACDDVEKWGAWFEQADRRVAGTDLGGGVRVSTIFMGLDHSFGSGPPLLFETMIFGGNLDQDTNRYATWKEAEAGHARMVGRAKSTLDKGEKE